MTSVGEYIDAALRTAKLQLAAFEFPLLIQELIKSPEGVDVLTLENLGENGVRFANVMSVASAMHKCPVVMYDIDTGFYMFQSVAHKTTASLL